eukprot:7677636-Pyramimonas_sp.AAC.1
MSQLSDFPRKPQEAMESDAAAAAATGAAVSTSAAAAASSSASSCGGAEPVPAVGAGATKPRKSAFKAPRLPSTAAPAQA